MTGEERCDGVGDAQRPKLLIAVDGVVVLLSQNLADGHHDGKCHWIQKE